MPNSDEIIPLWPGCNKYIILEGIFNDARRNIGNDAQRIA